MTGRWLPVAAEVEWFAGHRGLERPKAVVLGDERLEVVVESASVVGPAVAGSPNSRVFVVRGAHGRRLRITVVAGRRAAVETESPG